jgi:hypothetical protein
VTKPCPAKDRHHGTASAETYVKPLDGYANDRQLPQDHSLAYVFSSLFLKGRVGAAVTLMLAFRRQRHQEHAAHVTAYLAEKVADNTKHDATERWVTDLYTKAAEQLGHAGAAVRLAGLYALERLAQDDPGHRQTIVNVICAYLRMP